MVIVSEHQIAHKRRKPARVVCCERTVPSRPLQLKIVHTYRAASVCRSHETPERVANCPRMPSEEPTTREIMDALIDFRDFVAKKFDETATKAELQVVKSDLQGLRAEMRAGFDRVDRRFERLESRIEDLETRSTS